MCITHQQAIFLPPALLMIVWHILKSIGRDRSWTGDYCFLVDSWLSARLQEQNEYIKRQWPVITNEIDESLMVKFGHQTSRFKPLFYCFVNFLCILLFVFLMYIIVFMIFYFLEFDLHKFPDIRNCANGPKDRINTVLVHFKKISNFHVFCTLFLYAQCGFGAILCRRASIKHHVTSRPMIRFSQTWFQKMRKTWKKKKLMTMRVAICGGREAVVDFVQGVKLTPPPPHS